MEQKTCKDCGLPMETEFCESCAEYEDYMDGLAQDTYEYPSESTLIKVYTERNKK